MGAVNQIAFSWTSAGSRKTLESKENRHSDASESLHRRVFKAKRDPESSPAEGGLQAILSLLGGTASARNDGGDDFGKNFSVSQFPIIGLKLAKAFLYSSIFLRMHSERSSA
jgi:hypothetical protein